MCGMWLSSLAIAYETDQYTTMLLPIADADIVWDRLVNQVIDQAIDEWNEDSEQAQLPYWVASQFLSRQAEVWAIENPAIHSAFPKNRYIYAGASAINAPMIVAKGIAPTLSISGMRFGADKLSHFFGVGAIYLHYWLSDKDVNDREARAHKFGKYTEKWYWGSAVTGAYSNADLVANEEGLHFLQDLLPDELTGPSRRKIIDWSSGHPRRIRDFHFAAYVNDFWSEAFNPNRYRPHLDKEVNEALGGLCGDAKYRQALDLFRSKNESTLQIRYSKIGLSEDNGRLTLWRTCERFDALSQPEREKILDRQVIVQNTFFSGKRSWPRGLKQPLDKIAGSVARFPHCKKAFAKARNEHAAIMDFWLKNGEKMALRIKESYANFLSFSGNYLTWNEGIKVYKYSNGNTKVCERRLLDADTYDIRNGFRIFVEVCVVQESGRNEFIQTHKYLVNFDNYWFKMLENLGPVMKNIVNGHLELASFNEGYYEFDDEIGYIYRTLQPYCRWY